MAKATDDEEKRKPKKGEKVATWLLTGMLILGLGGFGVTNFSNTVSSIGSVGKIDISTQEYARAMQQQANAYSQQFGMRLGVQDLLSLGLGEQVLSDLIARAALDNEAQALGISAGDQTVAAEVMKQSSFLGTTGTFDRRIYGDTLRQNGWTEADYEDQLRRDIARTILQGAVAGGFSAPQALVDSVYRHSAEKRSFSMIRLAEADLAEAPAAPTEEELRARYEADIATYTRPEAKRIRYAALLPDAIAADQPVDEALLRQLYDENIDQYVIPERRLVERLVYPDDAARDAAKASLDAGISFETLVEERRLSMDAIDMGDVSEKDLGAAGAAVFAAADGQVVAAETDLGPALFRVNGTLAGEETTFDEARAELAAGLQHEAAVKVIADRVEEIDDLLAGGETLETLAAQTGMELAEVDHIPGQQGKDRIEGYQAFRDAAEKLQPGDFAEAVLLDDGGVVAMEFVETVPPAPIPFEEVRDTVEQALVDERLHSALVDRAGAFKTQAEGGAPMESLSIVDVTRGLGRDGTVAGAPASLITDLFAMASGDLRVIEAPGFVALVRLDEIIAAPETGEDADTARDGIAAAARAAFAQDAMTAFTNAVTASGGISLDQNAINLVNTSLQ